MRPPEPQDVGLEDFEERPTDPQIRWTEPPKGGREVAPGVWVFDSVRSVFDDLTRARGRRGPVPERELDTRYVEDLVDLTHEVEEIDE